MNSTLPLWLRVLARMPWTVLYGFARFVTLLLHHAFHLRLSVVRSNIQGSLTHLSPREQSQVESHFYRILGELVIEAVKASTMSAEELRSRVQLKHLDVVKSELDAGRSVLIIAAHQANWEWMLLSMSLELGHPLDAAYKPLKGKQGERIMRAIRTRFGGNLVPAKELLSSIIAKRGLVRAVAMVADQEPVTTDYKWWTRFMGRDTAFYMGPEKIARACSGLMYSGLPTT
jgi:Kdo2-lipid IVA lauroyltransferase/acyltransferase